MPFETGAPQFGVNDAKVQTWTGAGTYSGTITDIFGIQMARVTLQVISAIANGDDSVIAAGARNTGAQLQMRFVGLNLTQMAVMTGKTVTVSASVSQLSFGAGGKMPYFGAVIKILSEETGDTWAYLPKCKIMSDFVPFQGEFGTFTTPELTVQAVPDATWGIVTFLTHPAEVSITVMPPANIVGVP
jgi:hypothetical protein